jgi:hypothetical protein
MVQTSCSPAGQHCSFAPRQSRSKSGQPVGKSPHPLRLRRSVWLPRMITLRGIGVTISQRGNANNLYACLLYIRTNTHAIFPFRKRFRCADVPRSAFRFSRFHCIELQQLILYDSDDYPINGLDNREERGYRTKGNGRSTAEKVRQHER